MVHGDPWSSPANGPNCRNYFLVRVPWAAWQYLDRTQSNLGPMRTRNFANWVRFGPRTVRETVFQQSEFDSNLVLFLSLGMTMLNYYGGKHHNCFWKPGKDKFKSFILSSLSSELFFQLTGYLSKHLTTSDSPCPIFTTLLPRFCHDFLKILPHPCRGKP